MKKTLKTSLSAIALTIGSAAMFATAPAMAQDEAAPAVETSDADPALWVVKDDDTTIYLFGTVHVLKPGLSWFDEAVKDAFDASDKLILEVIQPDPSVAQKTVLSLAIDPSNPLRSKLDADQVATYDAAMTKLSLPTNAFDQFEPWFAAINLGILPLIQSGYDPSKGAEAILEKAAKETGKEIGALEGFEEQLGFFDGLPSDSQIKLLVESASGVDEVSTYVDSMVAHWSAGDVEKLADTLNASFDDQILYETLLTKRNANWATWIENRLDEPGTVFIAVGAGHLAGKDSVQDLLKGKNLTATRIEY